MYLVVGANGFLGSYILKNILEKTSDDIVAVARNIDKVIESDRISWKKCDISDWQSVNILLEEINDEKNKKVIFLAAYHNPDMVENNPQIAWNINVTSLSYFINKLENVNCLFYPSTDSVYGDSIDNYRYTEDDKLNPVNTYGRQKVTAERVVLGYGYNVVRYPFLIAPSMSPVKKHFYDIIVEKISNGECMEMFTDSLRSTMSFDTGAGLLVQIIEEYNEEIPKVLNICGDDDLSKYDVGIMLAEKLGVDKNLIIPIMTESNSGIFEATRAKSTLMDNSLIKKVLGIAEIKLVL